MVFEFNPFLTLLSDELTDSYFGSGTIGTITFRSVGNISFHSEIASIPEIHEIEGWKIA
jgi:hypothetical protein